MAEIRNVGDHVIDLPDGQMVGPGEFAQTEDLDDPVMQDYITQGMVLLVEGDKAESTKKSSPVKAKEGGE
jgi:hypothetical protein